MAKTPALGPTAGHDSAGAGRTQAAQATSTHPDHEFQDLR